ncbi:hypothetical protein LPJ61_000863 [Coemansia biformis]|uniref:Glutathione S-transferase n=1 Tax=Coemansia biformis TaxID=1286918 RepID=A0A9W8D0N1_9FUNG|nr:hypothetical protein LPJ61_000863 [Coemansia biformis]
MTADSASSYTLRYFGVSGLGEASRLLLTAANVEWTEEHPEWPAEKPNQPFGRLPVLVEKSADGSPDFVISESGTIERYIARRYGFLPADLKQAAVQEQLRDRLADVSIAFYAQAFASPDKKEEKQETFEKLLVKFVEVQTATLKQNGNNGYLFGDGFSYADAVSYGYFKNLLIGAVKFQADIADYVKARLSPEIIKHLTTVEASPAVTAHTSKDSSVTEVVQA